MYIFIIVFKGIILFNVTISLAKEPMYILEQMRGVDFGTFTKNVYDMKIVAIQWEVILRQSIEVLRKWSSYK